MWLEFRRVLFRSNICLLQLGKLFVNDYNNYFLSTRTITSDNSVYQVEEDGSIYAGSPKKKNGIRPTLYLDANIDIKNGTGDKQNPYLIEKVNYEKE